MSQESDKQTLVEEIRHRIQLLVNATNLSEPEKVEVLRAVLSIAEDRNNVEQVVK